MGLNDVFNRLRHFDAYPKTLEDFRVKTFGGAAVTILAGALMLVLFLSELNYYLTTEVHPELFVDTTRGHKLRINADITFPKMPCAYLSVDAMDVSGEQHINLDHNIFKKRLDPDGNPIQDDPIKDELGETQQDKINDTSTQTAQKKLDPNRCESCYGAENNVLKCCNTCDDVREAYRQKGWAFNTPGEIEQCVRDGVADSLKHQSNEGCRVYGYLEVNKVAGNFHFAPGRSFMQHHVHVHDLQSFGTKKFNLSHRIHHLSFGYDYPGIINPLDETEEISKDQSTMYQYYVKIVPTTYVKVNEETLNTNQYSVTKHSKNVAGGMGGETGLPGVFFIYELSPMMVKYTEKNRSFMHFLTGVCAIVGGIFTVAGLIDSAIYHSARAIQKKIELGKAS